MCDYSLHHLEARSAEVGDKIVSTTFPRTITRGFCQAGGNLMRAVCLKPGTEIAFAEGIRHYDKVTHHPVASEFKVAIFRQIDLDDAYAHHDALELPDGSVILVTKLIEDQAATVLQLPTPAIKPAIERKPHAGARDEATQHQHA